MSTFQGQTNTLVKMKILRSNNAQELFRNHVGVRFQLYNSLFTALPFHKVESTGVMLSLFLIHLEDGYKKNMSPWDIVNSFFDHYTPIKDEKERVDLLFRFIQYAERQVVLFDALEDGAFTELNDVQGPGSIYNLKAQIDQNAKEQDISEKLKDYSVRMTLTAHPTQFYPGDVLAIINDLSEALKKQDASKVNMFLQQLAKTPFFRKVKPTPFDEAKSLLWYLEYIFYPASGNILTQIKEYFIPDADNSTNPVIRMGFWPGGDRDGNPFVRTETTLKVANELRMGILRCYFRDVKAVRRRLTFKGVEEILSEMEVRLSNYILGKDRSQPITKEYLLSSLQSARDNLISMHNGLFLYLLDNLICKVQIFGIFFATLDIRQDSGLHKKLLSNIAANTDALPDNYNSLSEDEKIEILQTIHSSVDPSVLEDEVERDTLQVIQGIRQIQSENGEDGCNRYIISHSTSALDLFELMAIFRLGGWNESEINVDFMPLFESIEDLQNAATVMGKLYANPIYRAHLKHRGNKQSIMMGFSDGTKDGGYMMANWWIYKGKEELTRISRKYEIDVVFFDGRGGPPSRGGGKTQQFYSSLGQNIENKEIQLTIQGQTVSSNFGTIDAAQYNIEQLISAGLISSVLTAKKNTLSEKEESVFSTIADYSFEAYQNLRTHPEFYNYLSDVTPLSYIGKANIGSRPSKRNQNAKLSLEVLRAIPYVASWNMIMQNITGYYGVGYALKKFEEEGRLDEVKELYQSSKFFRTLLDNSEMSMKKSFLPLTSYLAKDPQFGEIWNMIYEEYELTQKMILRIAGHAELMQNYPIESLSIDMRKRIILPLTTIQQFAISELRAKGHSNESETPLGKMITRCTFGIINAGRNSA